MCTEETSEKKKKKKKTLEVDDEEIPEDELSDESDAERERGPTGSTLFGLFKEDNPVRLKIWMIAHSDFFNNWVMTLILLSCLQLAWETYVDVDDGSTQASILVVLDYTLSLSFVVEMSLKLLSNGLYEAPDAYLRNAANCLDGFIVCMSLVTMALASINLGFIKSLRALRCVNILGLAALIMQYNSCIE